MTTVVPLPQRLYTVVVGELSCGRKSAQAIHAVVEFALRDPKSFQEWHDQGNYALVLEVPTFEALEVLKAQAREACHEVHEFLEPDLGDRMTALTFKPSPAVQGFLAHLPSAQKHPKWHQAVSRLRQRFLGRKQVWK